RLRVRRSGALRCLLPVLTSRAYLRALQGESASVLGASVDELLRHTPELRPDAVDVLVQALERLVRLGGGDPAHAWELHRATMGREAAGEEGAAVPAGSGESAAATPEALAPGAAEAPDAMAPDAAEAADAMAPMDAEAQGVQTLVVDASARAGQAPDASGPDASTSLAAPDASSAPRQPPPDDSSSEDEVEPEEAWAAVPAQWESLDAADAAAGVPPETYLVECVTYTARALEQVLAHPDTAALF
ncbi:hypothetical protein H632_c4765p0, partial [Helicosporidium sp. ATCC 50920]